MTDIAIRRIELAQYIYVRAVNPLVVLYCSECGIEFTGKPTGTQLLELIELGTEHTARHH